MIYRISSILIVGFLVFSCNRTKEKVAPNIEKAETYVGSEHIVEAEELLKLLKQEHVKVIDFRKEEDYNKAHITGALNIWRTDIEDTLYPYGGMMAKKETVEALFGQLGIRNDDLLVVYDDRGSCDAARLWWLLKNYNFNAVKILNGGLLAWGKVGGSVSNETIPVIPSEFILPTNSSLDLFINKEEVSDIVISDKNVIILDTRSKDEFVGKTQKEGAFKGGRIPKSIHIDWAEAIEYGGTQKFKPVVELEKIYSKMGASKTDLIIVYCHTGVRSAHTTFVLTELLGYENVKNYDGSWTEWSYFDDLPFENERIKLTIKQ